ncbi:MAG: class I SAM-dependent methyltransferase [Planctomycetota bacterium]|nr:class I SAM-dependent methyltransferase [Planctomycetota bacterium]
MQRVPSPADVAPILADLGLTPESLAGSDPTTGLIAWSGGAEVPETAARLPPGAHLLVLVEGGPSDAELATVRNALWPAWHLVRLYRHGADGLMRELVSGRQRLDGELPGDGAVVVARRRELVLSPDVTVEKFDHNAAGWNGVPGTPGYAHFRWMRRFVGRFTRTPHGARILDCGCGAGWVGIEAATAAPKTELCFFDPSPEMVRLAEGNARSEGLRAFEGRVGFGEAPPFPAPGEERFDLVTSSGVLSFSPDLDAWIAGLTSTVKPGGVLVVGDLNPESRGMRRRRATKPLLPVRELNAQGSSEVRARLESAGFRHEKTAGYQLTRPIPQAIHLSDTRLKGLLSPPLLLLNRSLSALDAALGDPLSAQFDSWVMSFRAGP